MLETTNGPHTPGTGTPGSDVKKKHALHSRKNPNAVIASQSKADLLIILGPIVGAVMGDIIDADGEDFEVKAIDKAIASMDFMLEKHRYDVGMSYEQEAPAERLSEQLLTIGDDPDWMPEVKKVIAAGAILAFERGRPRTPERFQEVRTALYELRNHLELYPVKESNAPEAEQRAAGLLDPEPIKPPQAAKADDGVHGVEEPTKDRLGQPLTSEAARGELNITRDEDREQGVQRPIAESSKGDEKLSKASNEASKDNAKRLSDFSVQKEQELGEITPGQMFNSDSHPVGPELHEQTEQGAKPLAPPVGNTAPEGDELTKLNVDDKITTEQEKKPTENLDKLEAKAEKPEPKEKEPAKKEEKEPVVDNKEKRGAGK